MPDVTKEWVCYLTETEWEKPSQEDFTDLGKQRKHASTEEHCTQEHGLPLEYVVQCWVQPERWPRICAENIFDQQLSKNVIVKLVWSKN